jgi:DtxR family Mn-dependent transcriptional regulator
VVELERVEEYLETIYDIQAKEKRVVKTNDIAKKLGVKPPSVTEMLAKLRDMGYVEYQPYYGVILTDKGMEVAKKVKKYHNVFEEFFTQFLGLDAETAHRLSCELEHHVDEDVVNKVCNILATFECQICDECAQPVLKLSEAGDGKYEVIALPKSLESTGLRVDAVIELRDGEIHLGDEVVSISDEMMDRVVVRKVDDTGIDRS